jgi:hypothetical protein
MFDRNPVHKRILNHDRLRRIPRSFSWVDRRFLRDDWIARLSRDEVLLYFFLACVADKDGLSFYSDERMSVILKIEPSCIENARDRLVDLGFVAYQRPLYQVLSLDHGATRPPAGLFSFADVLARLKSDTGGS